MLLLFAALLGAAYAAGLPGEFSLDDGENFQDLLRFVRGDLGWQGVVFGNSSGPLGRPLSMAAFALTAHVSGFSPLAFKLASFALHGICGTLVALFLRAWLRDLWADDARAERVAVVLACWWLALPIHVSTVLYSVQRMTQLAAALTVAALLCYLWGRRRAIRGARGGTIAVWAGVPALALLAALAKENGLLAVPLCAVVEWTLATRAPRAPAPIRLFAWLAVVVPLAGVGALLALRPDALLDAYSVRPFTLMERLLTEPRILWSYVADILVPFGPGMGVIQDDVVVSRGWLEPPSTLLAALAWLLTAGAAIALRRRQPLYAAGVGVFLVGHALESTFIPLELYFEHRNYLPSLGVLLVVAGAVEWTARTLPAPTRGFRSAVPVLGVALALAYVGGTWARASVWRSEESLVAHAIQHHPDSPRLNSMLGDAAMRAGDLPTALRHFDAAGRGLGAHERHTSLLLSLLAHCYAGTEVPTTLLDDLRAHAPRELSSFGLQASIVTADAIYQGRSDAATADATIAALGPWLDALRANPRGRGSWRFRYEYGRMLATRGAYAAALDLIEPAWRESGWQVGMGVVAFQIAVGTENRARAEAVYARLEETTPEWDWQVREALGRFRQRIDRMPVATSP